MSSVAELIALLDRLEEDGYVELATLESAAGRGVEDEVREGVILIDARTRLQGDTLRPVTLCRLNRRHPLVQRHAPTWPAAG